MKHRLPLELLNVGKKLNVQMVHTDPIWDQLLFSDARLMDFTVHVKADRQAASALAILASNAESGDIGRPPLFEPCQIGCGFAGGLFEVLAQTSAARADQRQPIR